MAKAIPTPHYTTFFCARKMLAHFPYRAQKNVSYLERYMPFAKIL